jgi:hypothetical protein
MPHDDDALSELAERPQVADDGEVPEMPQQLPRECCQLFANRLMAVTPTPIRDAPEATPEGVRSGLLLHHPVSLAGHRPVMGEPQQVEGPGPGPRLAVVGRRRVSAVRTPEIDPKDYPRPVDLG